MGFFFLAMLGRGISVSWQFLCPSPRTRLSWLVSWPEILPTTICRLKNMRHTNFGFRVQSTRLPRALLTRCQECKKVMNTHIRTCFKYISAYFKTSRMTTWNTGLQQWACFLGHSGMKIDAIPCFYQVYNKIPRSSSSFVFIPLGVMTTTTTNHSKCVKINWVQTCSQYRLHHKLIWALANVHIE